MLNKWTEINETDYILGKKKRYLYQKKKLTQSDASFKLNCLHIGCQGSGQSRWMCTRCCRVCSYRLRKCLNPPMWPQRSTLISPISGTVSLFARELQANAGEWKSSAAAGASARLLNSSPQLCVFGAQLFKSARATSEGPASHVAPRRRFCPDDPSAVLSRSRMTRLTWRLNGSLASKAIALLGSSPEMVHRSPALWGRKSRVQSGAASQTNIDVEGLSPAGCT